VPLRIIQIASRVLEEAGFERLGGQSATCPNSNRCMMAASQVKSTLGFQYVIAADIRRHNLGIMKRKRQPSHTSV
jgi:hypothetical protein